MDKAIAFSISIKKKLKTLSIETAFVLQLSKSKIQIKKKLKTLSIETHKRYACVILIFHKEKAQNIEHRNRASKKIDTNKIIHIKKKLRTLSIETFAPFSLFLLTIL